MTVLNNQLQYPWREPLRKGSNRGIAGDNPSWPYLTLRVVDATPGTVQAVDLLQARLALWKASGGPALRLASETIKPDSLP